MIERILNAFPEEVFMRAAGLDDALIGVDESSMRLIYSVSKCISILMEREDMSADEAEEYFYYNTHQAYVGEKTPIWCTDFD